MDFNKLALERRSIRKFTDQQISDDQIKLLLESAMAAPSARNMQPWEFYVVKSVDKQNEIKNICRNFNFNSTLSIVVCGNKERAITQKSNDFWIQDCSAAIENILLSVTSMGLGAVWCGAYPVLERSNALKNILNANDNIVPMAVIQIGYPAEEKEERTQYNPDYVHYL